MIIRPCVGARIREFEVDKEKAVAQLEVMLKSHAQEEAIAAYPRERVTYITVVDTTVLGESYSVYIIVHMTNKVTVDLEMSGSITYDQKKNGYWIEYRGVRNVEYRRDGYLDAPPGIWEFGRN